MSFAARNSKALRARSRVEAVRTTLALANMQLAKLDYHHPLYAGRVWEFDQVMIELTAGDWFATRAMQAGPKADWRNAVAQLEQANTDAERLHAALLSAST